MSPEREIDETKGAKPDEKIVEEAAQAKADQEAKPRRRRRRKTEDAEVAAVAEEQAKPRRRRARRKKADEEEAEATEPQAEETEPESAEAEEPESAEAEEPEADEAEEAKEPEAAEEEAAEEAAPKPAPTRARRQPAEGPVAVRARARYVRTSARKARLVCDHIRGKSVPEARAILGFTPRAVARDWSKVLESAVANAEANHELLGDELKVTEAYADEGPTLKRFRPRAMGRATRIRKRTSHLTITLAPAANESKERSR